MSDEIKRYKEYIKQITLFLLILYFVLYVYDMLRNMFSNIKMRIISSQNKKSKLFQTSNPLLLDGHDSRINYKNNDIEKLDLYSYKFKKIIGI